MTPRRNKIKTAVNSVVGNVPSVQTTFSMEKLFKLVIDVLDDRTETG